MNAKTHKLTYSTLISVSYGSVHVARVGDRTLKCLGKCFKGL